MNLFSMVMLTYLSCGLVFLLLFDLITKRIRDRWTGSLNETQQRLAETGSAVGRKESALLIIGAMWLFWPMVLIGALTESRNKGDA